MGVKEKKIAMRAKFQWDYSWI